MDEQIEDAINTYFEKDDIIKAGMLSSPQIAYCQKYYNIIEGYKESCLSSATYHMRIGGPVLTWENGNKIEFTLSEFDDETKKKRSSIDLQPNSLTFVTTIEEFNLPKDIIARFNLKSKWVHKGLLLGTGPIVDPELKARLLIPLHNFSSQPISIKYNKKLISVEFTKTLNPEDPHIKLKDFEYKNNKSRIFDFFGYRERVGGSVESSVSNKFDLFSNQMDLFTDQMKQHKIDFNTATEKVRDSSKRFNLTAILTAIGTLIGLVVLVITTWMLLSSTFEQLNDAKNIVKQYQSNNIDYSAFVLKKDYDELQKQFDIIKKDNELINEITYSNRRKRVQDVKELEDSVQKSVEEMDLKIKNLEEQLKNKKL